MQDPYSLRCQPQVMGACVDQMRHAAAILVSEANAVSDNPLVFADTGEILSGGNFHAEPVAFAADNLALAIAEIGALSERRIALMMDANLSGLPPFLVEDGGVNSGFMIAQVTAAALASENKSLAHPASVDSLPTSANQEDHVSMATFAARRLTPMAAQYRAHRRDRAPRGRAGRRPAPAARDVAEARRGDGRHPRRRSVLGPRPRVRAGSRGDAGCASSAATSWHSPPISKEIPMHRDDPDQLAKAPPGHAPCRPRDPSAARPERTAKSWLTEAALRMIQNNLDPEVAENPKELVVYGGIGRAARNWECFDAILAALRDLADDESLLIQSGKPVGVFKTHADAPRVLIANSNLVPRWATWEHFNELDRKGLMMYGQMTAGSWIYIGSQGIVQGTYETFAEAGRQHYGGKLSDRWILTAGLGGMGGAQPLAATMAGASMLAIECQQSRIEMRLATRYLDRQAKDLDDALAIVRDACAAGRPVSVGLLGNAAEILPELVRRGVRPDMVTDQTSAHDLVYGYLPAGWTVERWRAAQADPAQHAALTAAAKQSIVAHVEAMLAFQRTGVPTFDYGNNIRQVAHDEGVTDAFAFPGFVPAYIRPLFCEGKGPFRWVALSGDPEDIYKTDRKVAELFPDNAHLQSLAWRWPGSGSRSRASPRASAGWAWASGISRVSRSTRW